MRSTNDSLYVENSQYVTVCPIVSSVPSQHKRRTRTPVLGLSAVRLYTLQSVRQVRPATLLQSFAIQERTTVSRPYYGRAQRLCQSFCGWGRLLKRPPSDETHSRWCEDGPAVYLTLGVERFELYMDPVVTLIRTPKEPGVCNAVDRAGAPTAGRENSRWTRRHQGVQGCPEEPPVDLWPKR
jgi:hypothetical protein